MFTLPKRGENMSEFERKLKEQAKTIRQRIPFCCENWNESLPCEKECDAPLIEVNVAVDLHNKTIEKLQQEKQERLESLSEIIDSFNELQSDWEKIKEELDGLKQKSGQFQKEFDEFAKWFVEKYGKYASADEITIKLGLLKEKFEELLK
jgi:DNA repair exonuclease SbcCD ATPase subunit